MPSSTYGDAGRCPRRSAPTPRWSCGRGRSGYDPAGKSQSPKPAPQPAVSSSARAAKVPKALGSRRGSSQRPSAARSHGCLAERRGAQDHAGQLAGFGTDPGFPGRRRARGILCLLRPPMRVSLDAIVNSAIVNAANSAGLGGVGGDINAAGGASLHAARQAMMNAAELSRRLACEAVRPAISAYAHCCGRLTGVRRRRHLRHALWPDYSARCRSRLPKAASPERGRARVGIQAGAGAGRRKIEYLGVFMGAGVFKVRTI